MKENPKISIIGYGVMGGAIIGGLLKKGVTLPEYICVSDPLQDRIDEAKSTYKINGSIDNKEVVKSADVVILSVKPQRFKLVASSIKGIIEKHALVLSIVAGVPIDSIEEELEHACIIRAMPNTPAQIGEGITVWTASSVVTDEQTILAKSILTALGQEVLVEEEYFLDMATALSGTGPAYVFMFMEAMIDAGVHLGFPRRISEQLVLQTMRGSVDYYAGRKDHPAHLRNEVTSPGGTSAAALYYLEKAGFRTAISRAVWAAYERSLELGKGKVTRSPEQHIDNNHK